MAYPYYSYGNYQPVFYQPPMQDQLGQLRQNQAPMMQPGNPGQPIGQSNGILWVPGYAAAAEYLVAANSAVALWDSNAPYVYLKQADSSGRPSLKVFELVERDPNQQKNTQDIQLPDFSQFVTRNELEEVIDRLKKPAKPTAKKEEE